MSTKYAWRLGLTLALHTAAQPLNAQAPSDSRRAAILAVVDSALAAINVGNLVALADLMLPEAQMYPSRERSGAGEYSVRTALQQRTKATGTPVIERGFDADVRVSGSVAVVWLPYDLYAADRWSHCGVDVFTLVRTGAAWRIANLTYSVEQPPACRVHPAGPPGGLKAP